MALPLAVINLTVAALRTGPPGGAGSAAVVPNLPETSLAAVREAVWAKFGVSGAGNETGPPR